MPTENKPAEPLPTLATGKEPKSYPDRLCHIDYTAHPYRCGCLSGDEEAQRRFDEYQRDTKLTTAGDEVARLTAERDALQQRLNAADQRIDDLAAAAEPFAKVADLYAGEEDDSYVPARDMGMHADLRLTLGQFRALSNLCTRPLMVGCKNGILCCDLNCKCKGNGFVERASATKPFTEQFLEDHLGKLPQ